MQITRPFMVKAEGNMHVVVMKTIVNVCHVIIRDTFTNRLNKSVPDMIRYYDWDDTDLSCE